MIVLLQKKESGLKNKMSKIDNIEANLERYLSVMKSEQPLSEEWKKVEESFLKTLMERAPASFRHKKEAFYLNMYNSLGVGN